MTGMDIERHSARNTAIVLVDHVVGFGNTIRSQPIRENIDGAVALAKIA